MATASAGFFVPGGTLRSDAPSYVERQADRDLYAALCRGEFCYVLTSRQMGKSSLMVHTAARLRQEGVRVAILDFTAIGQNLSPEQWYGGLLRRLGRQLDPTGELEDKVDDFWHDHVAIGPLQRWMAALEQIVLPRFGGASGLVIFLDEIDAVRSLPFSTDEFFAGIRECYNRRSNDPTFQRLTFCLLGVATPSDLIRDTRMTPFNIGYRIELTDFTAAEAAPLAQGLGREGAGSAPLQRVLYWTGGHPYLTQRLCQAVAENEAVGGPRDVDRHCEALFLSAAAREKDDNLIFVRERLLRSEAELASLLDLFGKVRSGQPVRPDDTNPLLDILRLSGIARLAGNRLVVRNRIYERVFDREWVTQHMPDAELRRQKVAYRRGLVRATAVAGAVVAVMGLLTLRAARSEARALGAFQNAGMYRRVAEGRAQKAEALTGRLQLALKREEATSAQLKQSLTAEQTARGAARREAERARVAQSGERKQRLQAEASEREAVAQREHASRQKQVAVAKGAEAERERRRAVAAHQRAEERLVRLNVATGMRLVEDGDVFGSLPWFVEALRLDQGKPEREVIHRMRLGTILRRCPRLTQLWVPGGAVNSVRWSPDGRRVIAASGAGTAHVWDAATGKAVLPPLAHRGVVRYAEFSGDGRRVVTASEDNTARVWDAATGAPIGPPLEHKDTVVQARFSPDGSRVVTASADQARVWDALTGAPLTPPLPHSAEVNLAAFSADGRRVLTDSGGPNGSAEARVWDAVTGNPVGKPISHLIFPRAIDDLAVFSPDGTRVVTPGVAGAAARVWDAATGEPASRLLSHRGAVFQVAFSPDGRRVVTASGDGTARVWEVATGEPVTPPLAHRGRVFQARFSPDGRRVVTASQDRTARVWDAATGQPVAAPLPHGGTVTHALFSPDGRQVVTTGDDNIVRVWDLVPDDSMPAPLPNPGASVAFSPDGRRAVTGGRGGAQVWDTTTWQPAIPRLPCRGGVSHAAFSPDGRRVVTASGTSASGEARVWDAATGEPITAPFAQSGNVRHAVFSPDSRRIATASGATGGPAGEARIWDAATGEPIGPPLKHTAPVLRVAFSPDGRRVATASMDRTAVVWDAVTGQPVFPPLRHVDAVLCVAFSPAGDRIVTGSGDGTARLWNAATGQSLAFTLRHQGVVSDTGFSRDGRRLVTASGDGTARVWDVATGRPLSAAMKHAGYVQQAAFSPDGRTVATASIDYTARVWDAATGDPLTPPLEHRSQVFSVSFSPDGLRVLTTGDGTARVWDLRPDTRPLPDLIDLAQLLSSEQTDATGSRLPVETDTLRQTWQRLRTKYPATFAPSIEQVLLWHQREASAWGRNGDWAAAVPHLDLLVAAEPAQWQHRSRRATASAALSRWDQARQDFARAIELGSDDIGDAYGLALAQVGTGDTDGYRATCARVLDRFGRSVDPNDVLMAARLCTLLPDAVLDPSRPLQLAEQAAGSDPTDNVGLTILGAALYRAGRYDAAVQRLSPADARQSNRNAYPGFFLAMAHARLGHAAEALQGLEQAAQWLDEALQRQPGDVAEPPLSWQQRLELQLQRREAEALIMPAQPPRE